MAQAATPSNETISPEKFRGHLSSAAFAFRGYNVTNLGYTPELLEHPIYGPVIEEYLDRGSNVCADIKGRRINLTERVRQRQETCLATYDEAVALILAVEMAHVEILRRFHGIELQQAQVAYGFSLGEIAALIAGGVLEFEDALRIPIAMSDDSVDLAREITLAVLFSLRGELSPKSVSRLCQEINEEGQGVIGVSAWLAPNSLLVIGQGDTLDRLAERQHELSAERVFLRRNDHQWPPLHTPIVWQRAIPNRSQHLMHTMATTFSRPTPPIFSLVTGAVSYNEINVRETIGQWVDHPQRLWDAIDYTLSEGVNLVVHVGPEPNIIPATFDRLATNVEAQSKDSVRMRALSGIVKRPWLQTLLPRHASLLRAPLIAHIRVEDWLLEHNPK